MSAEPQTTWRLAGVPEYQHLNLRLVVDTTAPAVLRAIEAAASRAGILLEREPQDTQQ